MCRQWICEAGLCMAVLMMMNVELCGTVRAGQIFNHSFDDSVWDTGDPKHFAFYGTEHVGNKIANLAGTFQTRSLSITVDFSQTSWGAIALYKGGPWDMTDATISANIRASTNLTHRNGRVGFKVIDADGTECRTPEEGLFRPSDEFQTFLQQVSALTFVDQNGKQPGLDPRNITHYGILFYDHDDHNESTTFFVDDFMAIRGD